jgi:uncharacterized protein YyaL (SSP411 family)
LKENLIQLTKNIKANTNNTLKHISNQNSIKAIKVVSLNSILEEKDYKELNNKAIEYFDKFINSNNDLLNFNIKTIDDMIDNIKDSVTVSLHYKDKFTF